MNKIRKQEKLINDLTKRLCACDLKDFFLIQKILFNAKKILETYKAEA